MLLRPAAVCLPQTKTHLGARLIDNIALLGTTNPLASAPGTIRGMIHIYKRTHLLPALTFWLGDYALDTGRNVCHGSDSVENAKKEIALWFKEGEVLEWKSAQHDWVYEK